MIEMSTQLETYYCPLGASNANKGNPTPLGVGGCQFSDMQGMAFNRDFETLVFLFVPIVFVH